ncbi:hypothetical protein SORBI_3006G279600 [Sorghum bicolor]|uniref:Uncharacterized protein n=1 Tax=Sorghum bicolor TaxID=4558 RepID=A0A1B6PPC6_SORBI|nr:hypothetical protein SORBI_3006G279600 [Sorghum bicolor]
MRTSLAGMVPGARTNPDVLLLHRGIALNHSGVFFPHTSARTYPGCSLSFAAASMHPEREGNDGGFPMSPRAGAGRGVGVSW